METVRPWNEKYWFSPCYVIQEWERINLLGNAQKIKRANEAWICAVAMICQSKIEHAEWWIQIPKNDPPDVLAMKLFPHKNGLGNSLHEFQVEVFEISSYDKQESIEDSIVRKLGIKDYSGMHVIAFVRRLGFFDHNILATHIQNLRPKALSISLIVREEENTNISFIQLFPDCLKFKHDWGLVCKTTDQRDFIEVKRETKVIKNDEITNDRLMLIP
jgi:hypothetical protein